MILIKQIEISYLRSLYRAKFDSIGDLNLIFGRNDSGKSNFLRALNLFFNGMTDNEIDPEFSIDFSDIRREEAKKGQSKQFIAIRIDFNVPPNYRRSLGEQVSIKRQWNIGGDMTETPPRNMTKGTRIQLTKFLNSIDFTYVPAIKDREVFADLIQRMYDATAQGLGLQNATDAFVAAIRDETVDLSAGLTGILGADARLAAPTEMGLLFRSLDFSHGENEHSLLLQKGDGVKARHIPEILRYINDKEKGKKYFIWGFEEPENSLDFSNADAEAKRFATVSAKSDTQVFITSHSPAFYLAAPEGNKQQVRRYFVSKQMIGDDNAVEPKDAISRIDDLDQAEAKMRESSLLQLPFLIRKWSELKEQNSRLSEIQEKLNRELAANRTPMLYVEGDHDVALFRSSLNRIRPDFAVNVASLGGTPADTAELIRRILDAGGNISNSPSLFLFDNDKAGRAAYLNLSKSRVAGAEPQIVAGLIGAWALPRSAEVLNFCNANGIRDDQAFFTAEFLFPGADAAALCLELMTPVEVEISRSTIHDSYHRGLTQECAAPLRIAEPGTANWLWSRGVPDGLKERYFRQALRELNTDYLDQVVELALVHLERELR